MSENLVLDKSKTFALRIIKLCRIMMDSKREFVLSKQLLRCGTSIGANVRAAQRAEDDRTFLFLMNTALKDAAQTEYWLELIHESEYLTESEFLGIISDCGEVNRLLIKIVKTATLKVQKSQFGAQQYVPPELQI